MTAEGNTILDAITIGSILLNAVFMLLSLLTILYARSVWYTWIKSGILKKSIFIRWTGYKNFAFDLANSTPEDSKHWNLKQGKKEVPYEIDKKAIAPGPDRVQMMLVDDDTAAGIDIDKLLNNQAIGATPRSVQDFGDMSYIQGYKKGWQRTSGTMMDFLRDNIAHIFVIGMMLVVGIVVLQDRVISAPQAWAAANRCEQEKSIIIARTGGTLEDIPNLPPQEQPSNTGGKVGGG